MPLPPKSRDREAAASLVFAASSTPEVSRSSRCTSKGRGENRSARILSSETFIPLPP